MEKTLTAVREPLWTKTFMLIILVNFLMFMSMYLLMPTLPVYAQKIGGSETVAGMIVGLFTLSAVAVRPWFGNMLDHTGRKTVLIIGIALFVTASFVYNLIQVIALLLALRVVHGVGWGATTTAAGTIASDVIPAPRRGEGMGYYGISTTIAMSIGPALGLYIIKGFSFTILFLGSGVLAVAGFLTAMLINYERKGAGSIPGFREGRPQFPSGRSRKKGVIIEKTAVPTSLVLFFTAMSYGGIVTFLKQYADYRGVANIGWFFTVYALVLLVSRPQMGRMADKYGAGPVLVPGIWLVIVSLLTLMAARSLPVFLAAAVLYGLGFGAVQPVLNAVTISLAPPERRGAANATFFSAMDLGIGLGAVILGAVLQRFNYVPMFAFSAVLTLLSMVVYFTVLRAKLAETHIKG